MMKFAVYHLEAGGALEYLPLKIQKINVTN